MSKPCYNFPKYQYHNARMLDNRYQKATMRIMLTFCLNNSKGKNYKIMNDKLKNKLPNVVYNLSIANSTTFFYNTRDGGHNAVYSVLYTFLYIENMLLPLTLSQPKRIKSESSVMMTCATPTLFR